jgi:carboxyl-terminal processing protease
MNPELIRQFVRGPRGSSVSLLVLQNKKKTVVNIERAPITQECIDLAAIVKPGVGYIRLNRFAATAYEEFMQQLENLKSKGMHTLILDLQENGGGLLDDAVQIADEFLDNNKDIVYTEGAHSPKKTFLAKRPGLFEKGKLIVLINEHTASASEVLAGALQDWDRATIIGRRSYGKGLVQEEFSLSDGSALRLTISRYFTPLGRNIQKPYTKGKDSLYVNELHSRYKNGDLINNDSAKHNGKEYRTRSGRIVYGGWGITPDQFVAADSAELALLDRYPQIFTEIASSSFNYYNANKEKLASVKQPAELNAYLDKDPLLLALIKNKIEKSASGSSISKNAFEFDCIKRYAFQYIARLSLGKEGYFSFLLLTDPLYNTAINQLK